MVKAASHGKHNIYLQNQGGTPYMTRLPVTFDKPPTTEALRF